MDLYNFILVNVLTGKKIKKNIGDNRGNKMENKKKDNVIAE